MKYLINFLLKRLVNRQHEKWWQSGSELDWECYQMAFYLQWKFEETEWPED